MESTNDIATASATPQGAMTPICQPKMDRSPSTAFWASAHDYYQAAVLVSRHEPRAMRCMMVDFFTVCRSIELSLKSYLRAKGWRVEDLIKIGHDLERALDAARKEGIETHCPLSPEFIGDLYAVNVYYKNKDFEYLVSGLMRGMPRTTSVLLNGAAALLNGLHKFCLDNIKRHDGKESAYNPFNKPKRNKRPRSVTSGRTGLPTVT